MQINKSILNFIVVIYTASCFERTDLMNNLMMDCMIEACSDKE
jgi:hypothetical protein